MLNEHYKTLGLPYGSSRDECKKAFHKLVHIHHPYKGGDEKKMKALTSAWAVLQKEAPEKPMVSSSGTSAAKITITFSPDGVNFYEVYDDSLKNFRRYYWSNGTN